MINLVTDFFDKTTKVRFNRCRYDVERCFNIKFLSFCTTLTYIGSL